jgi:biopolymer transport protein ExbD
VPVHWPRRHRGLALSAHLCRLAIKGRPGGSSMIERKFVTALPIVLLSGWIEAAARRLIKHAARNAPGHLCDRLEEEWSAGLSELPGRMSRLRFALGCYWASAVISHDHCPVSASATNSPTWNQSMAACVSGGPRALPRTTSVTQGPVLCELNITPLIDVMLVLLVTLIVSLPITSHAVKLDLPQTPPTHDLTRPEVVNLDIEFDGTLEWNGRPVAGLRQLESYLRAAARKNPQPQIHLRPDRHVKYDFVAQVLASAQRNHMQKMGFVNTGEFGN